MTEHFSCEIAVIGAGVVGLTTALALARDGREVVLVDPNMPGSGASYGNAGTIADYAVLPVGTPEVLKSLPSLLFDRNSPLSILRPALPSLAPWLARFARQSLPGAARSNAFALAQLVASANPGWQALAASIGAETVLQQKGCLYLHETEAAFRAAGADLALRKGMGVTGELIGPNDLARLEPALPGGLSGATLFPEAVFLSDPGLMMLHLAAAVEGAGVPHLSVRVDRLERHFDGVSLHGPEYRLRARRVVLSAGAHSRDLARQAGDHIPLETERGYHVEWDMDAPLLSRPACPTARGFYLCPMAGRLRAAGTVELGGLTAPPSPHRIARLIDGARAIFPGLGQPDRDWMGFRPSLPDSLPVIGPSQAGAEVMYAFGHGHIGLTLAPITARIVADLVAGRAPEIDIAPYRAARF
jgi:glycine/D-amino acid oxidase-like deaminating enzyme